MASKLRVVLVGKTGVGKTTAMNILMKRDCTSFQPQPTTQCKREESLELIIIDTPGVLHTKMTKDEVQEEIAKCMLHAAPGPHVFLYVMKPEPPTKEDYTAVEIIQKIFGKESKDHTLVLFTHGDEEDEIPSGMNNLMKNISGQYHFFDETKTSDDQVDELQKKINKLVENNQGKPYSREVFKKAQEVLEKEGVKNTTTLTEDTLEHAVKSLLECTMGEPLAGIVLGVVGLVEKDVVKCAVQ